jgi:hypothetical protein
MNEKAERYIAWGLVSLLSITLLFLNDSSYSDDPIFTKRVKETMIYHSLRDIFPRGFAYYLWYACLAAAIYVPWRYRGKIASFLKKIHESV